MSRMPAIAGEGRGLRIAFLVALGLGQAGAAGIAAFATRETFSALRQAGGELPLLALTAIAVAGAVIAGLRWGERLVAEHLGQDYVAALRLCLFDHVAQLPAGTIARQRTGAMSLRFVGDLSAVRVWVSLGLGRLLSAALVLPTMIGVLYLLDRGFGVAAGVLFGIAIVAILALGPQLRGVHRRLRSQRARLAADVAERLPHAPHLRLLGRFQHERERLLEQTRPLVAVFCERQRRAALLRVIPDVAQGVTATVILWIAFYSGATPAEAAGGLAAVALMVHPLRDFATIWDKHAAWHCAKRRCQALLARPTLPQAGSETLLEPAPKFALHSPAIKLNSVHQGPLRALDLDLRPGEKIGISGRNGSGKSTLLALCAGLETPERGEVRIAGRDPARLPDVERQQLIAFCGPRSPVLSGSLRRALTLGLRRRPSDAVISSRARQLGLGALLERPGGLDSRVAEAGRNLSAGELRRLLLTRVALSDAPLLLLDEPDEGLDQTGRRELVQLLQEREATVILVSHDPELLASLDRTYCIREGRLVESSPPVSPGTANRKRGKTAGGPLAKRAEPIATPAGKSSQHCDLTRSSIAPLGLLSFLLLILMQASPAAGQPSDVLAQLQHRATLAVDYLHRSVDDNGRFVYKRDQAGRPQGQRYNLLRHAGTLWAMCDYHREVPATSKQAATLQRAARFLVDCCLAPAGEADAGLALWSYPRVTGKPDAPEQAKLGGAGLALAAFAGVEALQPSTIQGDHLRGLGSFIHWMQRTDGSFYSKLIPSRGGRNADWVSLYYPGEAVLGLLLLYDDDGDRRWLEAALDALRYLARSREQSTLVPADHWALIATARVFGLPTETLNAALPQALPWTAPVALRSPAAQVPTSADVSRGSSDNADAHVSVSIGAWGDVGVSEARSLLLGHATSIIDSILAEQIGLEDGITTASGSAPRSCLRGGFDPDGRTAPTATRLEGLLAALTFLPAGERRQRVDRAVASGMAFLTGAQLLTGPNRGGVPRFAPACKSSNRRAHEVRIDDVQHSLSAMLAYRRYIARNHDGAPPHPRSDAAGKRPLD